MVSPMPLLLTTIANFFLGLVRKPSVVHETHNQYNKMQKIGPSELSRLKTERETSQAQELHNRRQSELQRVASAASAQNAGQPVPNGRSATSPVCFFVFTISSGETDHVLRSLLSQCNNPIPLFVHLVSLRKCRRSGARSTYHSSNVLAHLSLRVPPACHLSSSNSFFKLVQSSNFSSSSSSSKGKGSNHWPSNSNSQRLSHTRKLRMRRPAAKTSTGTACHRPQTGPTCHLHMHLEMLPPLLLSTRHRHEILGHRRML